MAAPGTKVKWHCNRCLGETWHTVLHAVTKEAATETHEDNFDVEVTDHTLAECNGCEYVVLRTAWSINGSNEVVDQFPPALTRRRPAWLSDLCFADFFNERSKYLLLQELYRSIGAQNYWLTVLGVRSLLEHVMIEKVGDQRTFAENLMAFHDQGFISRIQKEALGPLIEAGHASTHRGYRPTAADVQVVMDILENIIESIYVTKERADKLNVPAQQPRVKRPGPAKA